TIGVVAPGGLVNSPPSSGTGGVFQPGPRAAARAKLVPLGRQAPGSPLTAPGVIQRAAPGGAQHAADTIDQRRMMRKLPAALAAGVLVLVGGALVASADTPDPCEDARSDRDYIACRADRHDAALADLKERLEALERKVDDLPAPADPAPSE